MAKGKTNWGKIAIWTAIIGGAGVGLYFGIKKVIDAGKENETVTPPPAEGGAENTEIVSSTVVFPLKNGSGYGVRAGENAHVKVIQRYLNKLFPNQPMNVDGKWGSTTDKYMMAVFGMTDVSEGQYKAIKADKALNNTASVSSPNRVILSGRTYAVVENAPIEAERVIAAELLRQLGKAVTEANIKSYTDTFSFGYMVMRWYYAKNGYGVFIYNNESYSVSTGKKIVL